MSYNQFPPTMENRLDSLDQLFAEEEFERNLVLENVVDLLQEKAIESPFIPTPIYHYSNFQSDQSSYTSSAINSPESVQQVLSPPFSATSSYCSRPESAYSSSSETWYPSDCPPSTSSSASNDSNMFHFSPKSESLIQHHRPKRAARRTRANTPTLSPIIIQQATRGRGRPMKDNTDGDQTVIRKRIYAREYRKKNQKTHDELFSCLMDLYKVATNKGIDFSKMFPQHKKIISEIVRAS